jgi:hypothetical protein
MDTSVPAADVLLALCINIRRALYKHKFPTVADTRDKWWGRKLCNINDIFLDPYRMADNDIGYIGRVSVEL